MHGATYPTVHIGQVRNDFPELFQADAREFYGHLLVGNGIFPIGIEMDAGALFVVQTHIAKDASPIRQIKEVPLVQLKRTIDKYRILGKEFHADSPSSKGGSCPQIHAFFLPGIEVLEQEFRFSITDITIKTDFKCFLVRLGGTNDLGQEIQSLITMPQVNANGIYHEAVRTHII